ncbi:hypothetical protein HOLleu_00650 [Holothuria leucospilota]|uniref:Uncharacterized protein n=1 Tax=Holothuria leucospilota TaxID=206669 RepID=A0A9Q1CPA3_HOLLE|nr:hypothetical protein HOLleu_00650 [Holothuria leucospilota]
MNNQPKASGLLAEFRTPKFLGVVYILRHILPVLSILSKSLQAGDIHHSALQPAIDKTLNQLKHIADTKEPIVSLQKDMDPETGRLKLITRDSNQPGQNDGNGELQDQKATDADSLKSQLRKATKNGIYLTGSVENDLARLLEKYVPALSENIVNRFKKVLKF